MAALKTVLIVEDNAVNRKLLSRILAADYRVLEAENGEEGLAVLTAHRAEIAAVVLDLIMPVLDGYGFLARISGNPAYHDLPVIVSTGNNDRESERQALTLGAWDFVSKPYDAGILRFRLKNAIERSQLTAFHQLKYIAEYDTLTGIYNKSKFFEATRAMLRRGNERPFVFLRVDIDRFQLVNAFYGTAEGDELLQYVAEFLRQTVKRIGEGTYGRMEADVFALCIPYRGEEALKSQVEEWRARLRAFRLNFDLVPTCGVYLITDIEESLDRMLDKASLAAKRSKGRYLQNYMFYTEEMSRAIEDEQAITNNMAQALAEGQFLVYLQPKYSLATNRPEGAEALVRWRDPEKGMISPGKFIPIFERNGFITQLDYYVWEEVCKLLRRWLDQGVPPLPVSVNISRVDIYTLDLVERLCALTEKYRVPHDLLHLELTESAYADNAQIMTETMRKLQSKGFVLLMDDFGSGYSSLNVLKDMEVDILKLDMVFLSDTTVPGRGENIISSVVRMAKWLHIPVIAEGVEKEDQVEFLRGIGCEYVQGYYFAKPMPVAEYEALIRSDAVFRPPERERFDADELWVSNSQMEMLFSSVLQPVAIYEFADDHLEILRVNRAYHELFGYEGVIWDSKTPLELVKDEYRPALLRTFRQAVATMETAECEYQRTTAGGKSWVDLKLKYINRVGDKHIVFGSLTDITAQKEIDLELQKYRMLFNASHSDSGKMLIVDDQEINREILKQIFRAQFTILEAENGQRALEMLETHGNCVDIILLDLMMPVMDGIEFLQVKRARPELSDIPVIIITADEATEQQVNTLALGANDYIVKPFVEEIVARRVNNVLESNRRFREILREYDMVAKKAQNDPLTGIYNRAIAEQLIDHVLANQSGHCHALVMLDVDDFKSINDTYGHACGDEALTYLAKKLTGFFRQGDIISRFGGDEFCVLMINVPSAEMVEKKCAALCQSLSGSDTLPPSMSLTLSVGAALSGPQAGDFATLYHNADQALYDAKRLGKNRSALYGHCAVAPGVSRPIDREWLLGTMDTAVAAIDHETLEVLYCNEPALRLLELPADYAGKPCYEVLQGRTAPCPFCVRDKLTKDGAYQWVCRHSPSGKLLLSRDKLAELNERMIHLELLLDLSNTACAAEQRLADSPGAVKTRSDN